MERQHEGNRSHGGRRERILDFWGLKSGSVLEISSRFIVLGSI